MSELDGLRKACLTPGNLQDYYTIGRVIGKGGFAVVREGTVKKNGSTVALKLLNPKAYLSNPAQARMLFHEISTLKRVSELPNANLLKFVAAHEDLGASTQPRLTIVTQLCSGGELFDRIVKAGHYSEREAAILVDKLGRALDLLHKSRIIHRDMKPENILYASPDPDAEPVIADFGLARLQDKPEVHASLVGTPGYLSPEIIRDRVYTPACDVWALGVILYILLCGYPPFYADDNKALYEQICAGAFEFHDDAWHDVSESAKDLLRRMLVLDPAARITLDAVVAHPWITTHAPVSVTHMAKAVSNLKAYNLKRKVKVAAMAAAFGATHLANARELRSLVGKKQFDKDELALLSQAFYRIAGAGSTTVNLEQFRAVLSSVGVAASLPADRLFVLFDTDGNGDVEYVEFLAGLARLRSDSDEALHMCFDIFDADKSGFLSRDELMRLLASNGLDLGTPTGSSADLGADESRAIRLAEVFSRMDTNHDEKISFEEFRRALHADPVVAEAVLKPLREQSAR